MLFLPNAAKIFGICNNKISKLNTLIWPSSKPACHKASAMAPEFSHNKGNQMSYL